MNPVNVLDYGVVVNPLVDNGAAINAAAAVAKSARRPLYFPAGIYRTERSLDFTNAPEGWKVYGDGGGTEIAGALSDPYAIVDATGSEDIAISDLTIFGVQGYAQTCGLLTAIAAGTYRAGLHITRCDVGGHTTLAGLVNVSSDLSRAYDCVFSGPNGVVLAGHAPPGIASAYQPIETVVLGNTQHYFSACIFKPNNGAGVWQLGSAVTLDTCYFALSQNATACVLLDAPGGAMAFMHNCRCEASSEGLAQHVLWVKVNSAGGEITGRYQVHGGPHIRIDPGQVMTNYRLALECVYNELELIGGGGSIANSTIANSRDIPATLGALTFNNVVQHIGGMQPWPTLPLVGANATNVWIGQHGVAVGTLALGAGRAISRHLRAAVYVDVPVIPAGGLVEISVPLVGMTNKDAVSANPRNNSQAAGVLWSAYPAAGAVKVRLFNPGAVTVAAKQWLFEVQGWQYA